ncbi:MAG: Nramp family divalent metal transporter [Acidobacteria bacterium]|nr:Nramp family divalent metal transporter [Acidobacteriota bacterium]
MIEARTETSIAETAPPRRAGWSSIGPGLVFVLTVVGTGDIVSNAAAGARYGYALLWALALTLLLRYVWVNATARYVLVTGESVLQGYGRLGNWIVWIVLSAAILSRHITNLYKVVLMGTSADLLLHLPTPYSAAIWSVFFTCLAFAMMFWGGYPAIERSCKFLIGLLGAALVAAALLSHPQPAAILRGVLVPSFPKTQGFYDVVLLLTAFIGTEAGSMTNLTYSYFIRERGWRGVSCLRQQRFDLAVSVGCMFLMGAMLQVAAAGTVHPLGAKLQSTGDLMRIFTQTLGLPGRICFALGLWAAAFNGFIGGTTGYGLMVRDICRNFIPRLKRPTSAAGKEEAKKDPIFRWSVAFWSFSPLYILFTGVSPVWLVLAVSSLVVALIPILALCLLMITNDKNLMGPYRNGWFVNAVITFLVLIAVYFTYRNGVDLWHKFAKLL